MLPKKTEGWNAKYDTFAGTKNISNQKAINSTMKINSDIHFVIKFNFQNVSLIEKNRVITFDILNWNANATAIKTTYVSFNCNSFQW